MNVLLRKLSPNTSWPAEVRELLEQTFAELELRDPAEIGCPEGWQTSPIWNITAPVYLSLTDSNFHQLHI